MAHTKAGGAAKRTVDVAGKRLGIKKFAGEFVKSGNIIVRQHGTRFHNGKNTMLGKDHTIYAVADGFVSFRQMTGFKRAKKLVDVTPERVGSVAVVAEKAPAAKEENGVGAKPKATKKTA